MTNKYRVHEVAKDFKLNSKDIAEIMTKYTAAPKNHMQVLTDLERAIIFDYLTQHNQIDSIESVFAEVYHEPTKAAEPAPKAEPAAEKKADTEKKAESDKPAAPAPAPNPVISSGLADILSSARSLGVEVTTK